MEVKKRWTGKKGERGEGQGPQPRKDRRGVNMAEAMREGKP